MDRFEFIETSFDGWDSKYRLESSASAKFVEPENDW